MQLDFSFSSSPNVFICLSTEYGRNGIDDGVKEREKSIVVKNLILKVLSDIFFL